VKLNVSSDNMKENEEPAYLFTSRLHLKDLIDANTASCFSSKISQCAVDQKTVFKIVNKIQHTMDDCSLPSSSLATELGETFNQFFLTKIGRIRHELKSDIADGPCLDLELTAEPLRHSESN